MEVKIDALHSLVSVFPVKCVDFKLPSFSHRGFCSMKDHRARIPRPLVMSNSGEKLQAHPIYTGPRFKPYQSTHLPLKFIIFNPFIIIAEDTTMEVKIDAVHSLVSVCPVKCVDFKLLSFSHRGFCSMKDHRARIPRPLVMSNSGEKKLVRRSGKKEHHLWKKRDSAGSGQKAIDLVRTISRLPNEKEAVYGALNKWIAWETEFPVIAAAKALKILRSTNQWRRIIQLAKWMLSKGQGATMATYDCLILAFDMDGRLDEAEMLWNMILHAHNRSMSKRLFSRMIALYHHHNVPDKVIEVFADMEELGVKPDEDTVARIARAFGVLGQEEKQRLFLMKYKSKWKYIYFKGERVRVKA